MKILSLMESLTARGYTITFSSSPFEGRPAIKIELTDKFKRTVGLTYSREFMNGVNVDQNDVLRYALEKLMHKLNELGGH